MLLSRRTIIQLFTMIKRILFLATFLTLGTMLSAQTTFDLMLKKTSTVKGLCGDYDRLVKPTDDGQPLVEVAKLNSNFSKETQELYELALKARHKVLIRLTNELDWTVRYQLIPQSKTVFNSKRAKGGRTVGAGQVTEILERIIEINDTIRREIQDQQ